jgi:hypothetical protein
MLPLHAFPAVRGRPAASRPGRATAASANRAIGKRRTGAGTCAGISSKRARAPAAARLTFAAFPLSSYTVPRRDRIADCNRVYIAAGPPQSTVLSPRQARVDRAPDSRVLRPSESLKVDRSPRHVPTRSHTDTPTRTDTQGHRTGRVREARQPGACVRPTLLPDKS